MTSPATRIYVRHAGDHSPEWLAEQERKKAERRAILDARQAELRERDPELAAWVAKRGRRRR